MVLRADDPRAWAGSIAFSGSEPDAIAVREHVARCRARGDLDDDRVPVLWSTFKEPKVYWERVEKLREV